MSKTPMTGAYARNPHEGSRSEILADYLFSSWGTVTPVRRQDDYGIDLYCTLSDRIGQRAVVRDYFVVQVKSGTDPWVFEHEKSVQWLVEYPNPLFLACVDKKNLSVSVYHVMPRFQVWAFGKLPVRLELKPEGMDDGESVTWENGESFSLSAPIIRATIAELCDEDKMEALRKVFQFWVQFDRENCDLVRQGLLRFRIPASYRVNELPKTGISQIGYGQPEMEFLERGILKLKESAECIGGQLYRLGDHSGALRATLLARYLLTTYENAFKKDTLQGAMGMGDAVFLCNALNSALDELGDREVVRYAYSGIDEVGKGLENDPIVRRFLTRK
jgi:hypothetical protein